MDTCIYNWTSYNEDRYQESGNNRNCEYSCEGCQLALILCVVIPCRITLARIVTGLTGVNVDYMYKNHHITYGLTLYIIIL